MFWRKSLLFPKLYACEILSSKEISWFIQEIQRNGQRSQA